MSRFPSVLLVSLLLLPTAAEARTRVEKWNERLTSIDAQLKRGEHERARDAARKLTGDMLEHIGGGPDAMYTLAVASAFRAVAEAGLKNYDDAEWYWFVARGLYDKFAGSNLAVYGDAGKWLMETDRKPLTARPYGDLTGAEAPVVRDRVRPKYPYGAMEQGIAQPVIVQVVIDESGRVHRPQVLETGQEPSLAYAALEALKQWVFTPAKLDGKPIETAFTVTIHFQIDYR